MRSLVGLDGGYRPAAAGARLEWVVRSGLGPLLWRLVSRSGLEVPAAWHEPLQAADLVARFETRKLTRTVESVVGLLNGHGIQCTLLKGISVATRYYPEPHLRAMGDADLLVARDALEGAVRLVRAEGFGLSTFAEPEWWDALHHAPPLIHPQLDVTIELHHSLLPPTSASAQDPPFDPGAVEDEASLGHLGEQPVRRLGPERELALLAAAWGNDLSAFLGRPGLQRPLVDCAQILAATGDAFDWDRVLRWTDGTATGGSLALLLGVLARRGALPCDPEVYRRVRVQAAWLGPVSTRLVHRTVRRHVVDGRPFGRILTGSNSAIVMRTLLAPAPAWRRWLSVPLRVVFPPANPRRFHPGFQLGRIRSLLRPGRAR